GSGGDYTPEFTSHVASAWGNRQQPRISGNMLPRRGKGGRLPGQPKPAWTAAVQSLAKAMPSDDGGGNASISVL
ncbi:MAG: hypothetical protein IKX21_05495, partial [Deltaproteobacteria bacterium]|nr:hypothetical protein [Deltaproteobacteria bacterium]